jgi:hypothetical protein
MEKVIHYTWGYGGNLNYNTICGKDIHSHSDTEGADIDPTKVTCDKCKSTDEWKIDHGHATGETKTDIKRRIYIESDIVSASELRRAQNKIGRTLEEQNIKFVPRVFSEVLDFAWHDLPKTWEAVKKADEIYAMSSLMPLIGGSYSGAPVIFNAMCENAIGEGIKGKSVYILSLFNDIHWDMIDLNLLQDVFSEDNSLYMYDEDYDLFRVDSHDIEKLIEK